MNKSLFSTKQPTVKNNAGGSAFKMNDKHALAQHVVTGMFGNTYYVNAKDNLKELLDLANKADSVFLAKLAVYGAEHGKMKDTPSLLLALLLARKEKDLFEKVFPRVVKNTKMLRNFVQMIRSGITGRKSFGSTGKNAINKWFASKSSDYLFKGSIGNEPSLADVVRMTHPKAESNEKDAFYKWLLGREFNLNELSPELRKFEDFKALRTKELPDVDFRMLSNINLTKDAWRKIAENCSWNTLRMNINQFSKKGVFDDYSFKLKVAERLCDREEIKKNMVFPYQMYTSYLNTTECGSEITNALKKAMEIACENVPSMEGGLNICVDVSGSMSNKVSGTTTSTMRYIDVAALMASSLLRTNSNAKVLPFDTEVRSTSRVSKSLSVAENATILSSYRGGGTNCASAIEYLNRLSATEKFIVMISDNESWVGSSYKGTRMNEEWIRYKKRVPDAKLVCLDICPNSTTQVKDHTDVLNLGGFSDAVWDIIDFFFNEREIGFVEAIETVSL